MRVDYNKNGVFNLSGKDIWICHNCMVSNSAEGERVLDELAAKAFLDSVKI